MAHLRSMSTRKQPRKRMEWKLRLVKWTHEKGFPEEDVIDLFEFIDWVMVLPEKLEQRMEFDLDKTIQACAVLFKETGPMSRLRLLKLLYIADRESLRETGRSITGDHVAAMDNGPVLSRTYDLIKGREHGVEEWSRFIESVGKRDLRLAVNPGVDALSAYEVEKLQEVANRLDAMDDWIVAEITHTFPEWQRNRPEAGSSREIPLEDILDAVGMSAPKDEIISEARSYGQIQRLLSLLAQPQNKASCTVV